mgnify:CR=1 FL=1|tara:strand:- start:14 stop:247 length:234 start_codon:yes stop_codon:yes gene_type:complete
MINQPQQVDQLTGMPVEQALPAQQPAQVPQVPSNELGSAAPVFNPKDQAAASRIYGDVQQKQNSVTPSFYNANTQTV